MTLSGGSFFSSIALNRTPPLRFGSGRWNARSAARCVFGAYLSKPWRFVGKNTLLANEGQLSRRQLVPVILGWEQVAIAIERHGDGGVAKDGLNPLWWEPLVNKP